MLISCIRSSFLHSLLYFSFLSLFFLFYFFFFFSLLVFFNNCPERLDSTVLFPIDFLDFPLVFEFRLTVTALVSHFLFLVFG